MSILSLLALRIFGVCTAVCFSVALGVQGVLRIAHPAGYPDPFAPYAAVFPGQPRSAVSAFGFSCPGSTFDHSAVSLPEETCVFWPASGVFRQVIASVSQDSIRQLKFVIRGSALKLGDLMSLWGTPVSEAVGDVRLFYWSVRGTEVSAHTVIEQHSILSPQQTISVVGFVDPAT